MVVLKIQKTKINECGMSIYSAGESHFSEDMHIGRKVLFWLVNSQESPLYRFEFYEDGYKIEVSSTSPEYTRKYVRCVKN